LIIKSEEFFVLKVTMDENGERTCFPAAIHVYFLLPYRNRPSAGEDDVKASSLRRRLGTGGLS
jgi:hypothetical protein